MKSQSTTHLRHRLPGVGAWPQRQLRILHAPLGARGDLLARLQTDKQAMFHGESIDLTQITREVVDSGGLLQPHSFKAQCVSEATAYKADRVCIAMTHTEEKHQDVSITAGSAFGCKAVCQKRSAGHICRRKR